MSGDKALLKVGVSVKGNIFNVTSLPEGHEGGWGHGVAPPH